MNVKLRVAKGKTNYSVISEIPDGREKLARSQIAPDNDAKYTRVNNERDGIGYRSNHVVRRRELHLELEIKSVTFRMVSVFLNSRIEYFVKGSLTEKAYRKKR